MRLAGNAGEKKKDKINCAVAIEHSHPSSALDYHGNKSRPAGGNKWPADRIADEENIQLKVSRDSKEQA